MKRRAYCYSLHLGAAALIGVLSGCGSGLNTNRIWGSDDSTESKLVEAKVAYDKGDFSSTLSLTSDILRTNPNVEEAAILQGYAYVSQAGLDPYRVASCLTNMSSTSSTPSTSSRCQSTSQTGGAGLTSFDAPIESWFAADTNTSSTSSSNNDSNVLRKLQSSLLSLSNEDFAKLKKDNFSSSTGLFATDNPLIIPVEVDENLRENVNILNQLNQAVKSVCGFVNDNAEVKADADRYQSFGCELTSYTRRNLAKAHYLWALSHLGEALTFTSVILYNSGDTSSYNFQRASTKLQGLSTSSVDTIVSQVEEMQKAVAAVFDTDNPKAMISKTLYDLTSTSGAFDAIAGLPDSVKKQITSILDGVKSVGKTISGTSAQSKALKTRLLDTVTTNVTKKISDTIGSVAGGDASTITPEAVKKLDTSKQAQVAKLCTSYDSLAKDLPTDKKSSGKPKACG